MELSGLRKELALSEAFIASLLGELRDLERLKEVKNVARLLQQAVGVAHGSDRRTLMAVVGRITKMITTQRSSDRIWKRIMRGIESKRRLVETHSKLAPVLTADQALVFISALTAIVRHHITDPETLKRIADDLQAVMGRLNSAVNTRHRIETPFGRKQQRTVHGVTARPWRYQRDRASGVPS